MSTGCSHQNFDFPKKSTFIAHLKALNMSFLKRMGLLFKFEQLAHEIFTFLYLQNMGILDYLVRIYKWLLKIGMAPKLPYFFNFY